MPEDKVNQPLPEATTIEAWASRLAHYWPDTTLTCKEDFRWQFADRIKFYRRELELFLKDTLADRQRQPVLSRFHEEVAFNEKGEPYTVKQPAPDAQPDNFRQRVIADLIKSRVIVDENDYVAKPAQDVQEAARTLATNLYGMATQLTPKTLAVDSMKHDIATAMQSLLDSRDDRWKCSARNSSLPEPQDCNWPFCGCDPYANKVLSAVDESCNQDARLLDEARAQRDWLIAKCGEIGVTVNVLIGAPLTEAYQLVNTSLAASQAQVEQMREALQRTLLRISHRQRLVWEDGLSIEACFPECLRCAIDAILTTTASAALEEHDRKVRHDVLLEASHRAYAAVHTEMHTLAWNDACRELARLFLKIADTPAGEEPK